MCMRVMWLVPLAVYFSGGEKLARQAFRQGASGHDAKEGGSNALKGQSPRERNCAARTSLRC
jgi:hypothetical protein